MIDRFVSRFLEARDLLEEFLADFEQIATLNDVSQALAECLRTGGKALAAGNGGSMCDAMHFAEEFSGRFYRDRRPYAVFALSDPAHMSCVANDYGYEHVFSRQAEALLGPNDLLFLMSTSGNSPSIVLAAQAAQKKGAKVVGFLGRGGGEVAPLCDWVVLAPGDRSDRIQEIHMLALHVVIEVTEALLGHE